MAVFVVDEAPLLPRSSVATTAQQQKGKVSALTVVDDPVTRAPAKGSKTDSMLTSRPIAQALTGKRVINTTCKQRSWAALNVCPDVQAPRRPAGEAPDCACTCSRGFAACMIGVQISLHNYQQCLPLDSVLVMSAGPLLQSLRSPAQPGHMLLHSIGGPDHGAEQCFY